MSIQQQGGAAVAGVRGRPRDRGGEMGVEAGLEPSIIKLDPHMEVCIDAYSELNHLMQDFIDHVS